MEFIYPIGSTPLELDEIEKLIPKHIKGQDLFSWGRNDLVFQNETRNKYIKALRAADKGDYKLLLDFVRS